MINLLLLRESKVTSYPLTQRHLTMYLSHSRHLRHIKCLFMMNWAQSPVWPSTLSSHRNWVKDRSTNIFSFPLVINPMQATFLFCPRKRFICISFIYWQKLSCCDTWSEALHTFSTERKLANIKRFLWITCHRSCLWIYIHHSIDDWCPCISKLQFAPLFSFGQEYSGILSPSCCRIKHGDLSL